MTIDYKALLREWSKNYCSFAFFRKNVKEKCPDRECMQAFAKILEPYQMNGSRVRKRFACQFFDTYAVELAGHCGCSRFIPDHRRINVWFPELWVGVLVALYRLGAFDCSASQLIRVIDAGFNLSYKRVTLERMFSEGTSMSDIFISFIKEVKVRKLNRKRE